MLTKISENWGSQTARETEGCFPCRLDRFFGYYGRRLAEGSGRRYVNNANGYYSKLVEWGILGG